MLMSILEFLVFKVAFHVLRVAWRDSLKHSREAARIKKHAAQLMAGRKPLSSTAFAATFFSPSERAIAAKIHEFLGEILIVDVTRVHPDDSLFGDLGVEQLDGMDLSYMEWRVKREWGVRIGPAWVFLRTVRDLVTYVWTGKDCHVGIGDGHDARGFSGPPGGR